MSNASEPGAGDPASGGISEEQAREYLAALRAAPAEQVVTEVLFGLLNAAQAKLGRKDGRLMIDLSAMMVDHVRPVVSAELAKQVDQALGQLRLGQVRAESAPPEARREEPNDLTEVPARQGTAAAPGAATGAAPPPAAPAASPTSRLWVPGRDF